MLQQTNIAKKHGIKSLVIPSQSYFQIIQEYGLEKCGKSNRR